MRERKRKHDDVHFPMGGRGAKAWHSAPKGWPRLIIPTPAPTCEICGFQTDTNYHTRQCSANDASAERQ